jgi:hypothetical protein
LNGDARERELARALGDILDRKLAPASVPELAAEIETLGEIDRALEPGAALPERLSGHRILGEIGSGGMGRVLLALVTAPAGILSHFLLVNGGDDRAWEGKPVELVKQ